MKSPYMVKRKWQKLKTAKIDYFTLTPEDFGLKTQSLESLRGGEPQEKCPISDRTFTR